MINVRICTACTAGTYSLYGTSCVGACSLGRSIPAHGLYELPLTLFSQSPLAVGSVPVWLVQR
jgi:hypothetical protein